MERQIIYTITDNDAGKTIHVFLREHYYPAKMITHLKHTENSVLLNGAPVFLNTILHEHNELKIIYAETDDSENIVPVNLPFKIIYEDEDIMVIDKPADMPVHPAINNFENTLANGISYYFLSKGEHFVFRCINRLDRNTSGLLIVAKHRLSAAILSGFMKKREIHRVYLALASGIFDDKTGTIDLPIGRVSDSIIERFVDFENGDSAITHYEVIKEFLIEDSSNNSGLDCSLLKITLDTGRTHQIRVHLRHIGHPLVGDSLYNKEPGNLSRQALHSHIISFTHPITLKQMSFTSDIDFMSI